MVKRIVLFASGSGTNVENIIKFFEQNPQVEVVNVFTNNSKAGVIDRIRPMKIPVNVFDKAQLNSGVLGRQIKLLNPDLIVLAGFLLKIPMDFINAFTDKIINIHPSLLPKYGGKGMYGDRVHQSVKEAGDHETGMTKDPSFFRPKWKWVIKTASTRLPTRFTNWNTNTFLK